MRSFLDPITRTIDITYLVPKDAPSVVEVYCSWSSKGKNTWQAARVMPKISETAVYLAPESDWSDWTLVGKITERRAAGLVRTLIFNPYPDAQVDGKMDVDFRVEIRTEEGTVLETQHISLQADNSDVVYIDDWTKVFQQEAVAVDCDPDGRQWIYCTQVDRSAGILTGTALYGKAGEAELPQLTYPLNLKGSYALFICGSPKEAGIKLRLTGDERADRLRFIHLGEEIYWRQTAMDHQHLVVKELHTYTGYTDSQIDYVKMVPLTDELVQSLEEPYQKERDKTVIAYFEPYSWAFLENVMDTFQHREPLSAYAEAEVDQMDTQLGRFGSKMNFESRIADQLLYATEGDPIDGVIPKTSNVGQMQLYTNMFQAELRYGTELGMTVQADFGGTNCYIGTPLQGDITREHPEWVKNHALMYQYEGVRKYILNLIREALELGSPGVTLDFCRYPEGIDRPETLNTFLRELKGLTSKFEVLRDDQVPVMLRFPATGVRCYENFDYHTWVKEGLVDVLCPSTIQGRHTYFDVKPYVEAAKGTGVKVVPVVDSIHWGPEMPGPYLMRTRQVYQDGADGVYIYQADVRILGRPNDRRCIRMLGSTKAVEDWYREDATQRSHFSKGIYLIRSEEGGYTYHPWERLRVWLEGIPQGEVELYLDGKLLNNYQAPPYSLGSPDYESDQVIPIGDHILKVRAKDKDDWLEQEFSIKGGE